MVISTQVPTDFDKGLQKNIDQWLLFAGHNNKRLKMMCEEMSLRILEQDFIDLYKEVTSASYEFLNMFPTKKQFVQSFHIKLEVE